MHRPFDEHHRRAPAPGRFSVPPPGRPHPAGAPGPWGDRTAPDPAQIDPAVLGALLDRHGWRRRGGAPGRYSRWTPPGPAANGTSLLVPEDRAFPDCEDLIGEALAALARCAAPSAREVLVSLAVPSDEIRWWRDIPEGPSGTVSWTAEEQLRTAVRQMLMAGALAARGPAGYHGARHRRAALATLSGVLVQPATGGRALTAFVPVRSGRAVAVRLCHALQAAREAVDYRRAAGGMEAFDAAVRAGVSRELTEAVIALVRGTEGARIAVDWAPAAGVPRGCAARMEPVEFSAGDLATLRAASARYLQEEPSVPVRLTGTVVRLRRTDPRGPGTVRLRVLAGAEVSHVRVVLDDDAYRAAGRAHLAGLPVRVAGRLESSGGFRRLADPGRVTAVRVDEAERDRLMKALREHPDPGPYGEDAGHDPDDGDDADGPDDGDDGDDADGPDGDHHGRGAGA